MIAEKFQENNSKLILLLEYKIPNKSWITGTSITVILAMPRIEINKTCHIDDFKENKMTKKVLIRLMNEWTGNDAKKKIFAKRVDNVD